MLCTNFVGFSDVIMPILSYMFFKFSFIYFSSIVSSFFKTLFFASGVLSNKQTSSTFKERMKGQFSVCQLGIVLENNHIYY